MTVRFYSSTAVATSLNGAIAAGATSITVNDTTGFPTSFPYTLSLDFGAAAEELVDVTAAAGLTLTVTRGVDGTSAQSHGNGAVVRHVASGRDFKNSRDHENASSGVHGLAGNVVGDTDTQTLTNKTMTSPTLNTATISNPTMTGGGSLTGTYSGTPSFSGNVTFSASPIFSGQPQITDFTNATHNHSTNAQGGSTLKVITVSDTNVTDVPLTVNGVASQTGNLANLKNNGTLVAAVTSDGALQVTNQVNATVPLFVNSASGQTGKLAQLQVNAVDKFTIDNGGNILTLGGGGWTSFTSTWGSSGTAPALGNGTLTSRYQLIGKLCIVAQTLVAGSTTTFGTGTYNFTTPFTSSNNSVNFMGTCRMVGTNHFGGVVVLGANATTVTLEFPASTSASNILIMTPTVPQTFASGNNVNIFYVFETV